MLELPPNPHHILGLLDDEFHRVRAENPDAPNSFRDCITCRGRGEFRWYASDGTTVETYRCDCRAQFRLHYWLLNAGIPKNYQRLTWTDAGIVDEQAYQAAVDYLAHADTRVAAGIGLVLYGDMGTGKSLTNYLLAKGLIARGHDVFALTMSEFLDRYAAGWRDKEAQRWFETRVRHAGVLVLDDLAREYSGRSQVAESALDHTLRARVGAQRPTLITSNRNLDELATIYSANALSLLSEVMLDYRLGGSDFRPLARKRRIAENDAGIVRPVML